MEISIKDSSGLSDDAAMPLAREALEYSAGEIIRAACNPRISGLGDLQAITVVRHKLGRRALLRYQFSGGTVLGKIRAKGLDGRTFELSQRLWSSGFDAAAQDGISVPHPLGIVKPWNMWLQAEVSGLPVTDFITADSADERVESCGMSVLAARVAEAAWKLHSAGIVSERTHTIEDELRILHERLNSVADKQPQWSVRISALLKGCDALGCELSGVPLRPVHRDFYPAQVLIDSQSASRVWLLDLDLCSMGDPALDMGNFIAHVTELMLRAFGNPDRLAAFESELAEAYVARAGDKGIARRIKAYACLSLARHVWISTQFEDRQPFAGRLLKLCEQRLGY